jgi:serine/threonine-protein kinase
VDGSVAVDLDWQSDSEARERVGTTLRGKWYLDALLGVGGSASVYSGKHRNGIVGAVKVLHPALARDVTMRERFSREGYVANLVDHPGVVQVIDDDETEDGLPFLVMELLEGRSLDRMAASCGGKIEPEGVLWIVAQVLDALAAAHDAGVVHRDLKPENVFLTHDGQVKVLDFGIAQLPDGGRASSRVTQVGFALGTPAFMPPEQARGRWDLVGPQTDLWAVGATMFTLLTGQTVHEGQTPAESLIAAGSRPARSLALVAPTMPPCVVELVDRALQKKLAERWEDARAMRDAVHAAFRSLTGRPMPVPSCRASRPVWSTPGRRPLASAPGSRETETVPSVEAAARVESRRRSGWTLGLLSVGLAITTAVAALVARLPVHRVAMASVSVPGAVETAPAPTPVAIPVLDRPVETFPERPTTTTTRAVPAPSTHHVPPRHRPDLKSLYDRRM